MPSPSSQQMMTMESTEEKKKKRLGLFRRKTKESTSPSSASPPRVVNVSSPFVDKTRSSPVGNLKDKSGAVVFKEQSKATRNSSIPPIKKYRGSWLTRTKRFCQLSNWAFDVIDTDGSGSVDEKELYSGLLLIHLKLGCYAGPAACRPVDRQRVHDIFCKMDVDQSGSLDRDEFLQVMVVLCSNVLTRVMVQCENRFMVLMFLLLSWLLTLSHLLIRLYPIGSMTLIIVPLVAQYILDALYYVNDHFWAFLTALDEYSPMMDRFELWVEGVRDDILEKLPSVLVTLYHNIALVIDKVPNSVWNTLPLTLLSCILGCLAVPYTIIKIDDYFQGLADKKKEAMQRS